MKTKPLTDKQIRKAYEAAGLKADKIAKARLDDGYYVYHRYGAESYSKTYPGRRRDFIDAVSKDSLGINITEARRRAGLPNLKNIKKIISGATNETKKTNNPTPKEQGLTRTWDSKAKRWVYHYTKRKPKAKKKQPDTKLSQRDKLLLAGEYKIRGKPKEVRKLGKAVTKGLKIPKVDVTKGLKIPKIPTGVILQKSKQKKKKKVKTKSPQRTLFGGL